jgi:outer membrane protein assembly factor BamB
MVVVNWIKNRPRRAACSATLLLVLGAAWFVSSTGVREIRRAGEPVNFALVDPKPVPGDWPWWRGTDSTNTVPISHPPVQWSATNWSTNENGGWHAAIPGRDHSSPCLWGDRIFLCATDIERKSFSLLCLDRESGRTEWQTVVQRGGSNESPAKNARIASTPACDGQHVYVATSVSGILWVTAVDLNGRIAWQRDTGPHFSKQGYSSSPCISKSLVIVAADSGGTRIDQLAGASHLTALHRQTGRIIWRVRRPAAESFGSPIVARVAGRDQLLLPGRGAVTSYDPATGDQLWTCRWSADSAANSVAFDEQHVFASTRHPRQELICIRADGRGDVTDSHLVWRDEKSGSQTTSPILFQGRLYSLAEDGILACLESGTGSAIWKRRLGGTFSSSPMIAGQSLYCANEEGLVFVIKLGGRGEVIAENRMESGIVASPIISENRLYLRTLTGLHCIVPSSAAPLANKPDESKRRL